MYEWVLGYLTSGFFSLYRRCLREFACSRLIMRETPNSVLPNAARPVSQTDLKNTTRQPHSSLPSQITSLPFGFHMGNDPHCFHRAGSKPHLLCLLHMLRSTDDQDVLILISKYLTNVIVFFYSKAFMLPQAQPPMASSSFKCGKYPFLHSLIYLYCFNGYLLCTL